MKKKDNRKKFQRDMTVKKMTNKKTYKKPTRLYRHNIVYCRQSLTSKRHKKSRWFKHWAKR